MQNIPITLAVIVNGAMQNHELEVACDENSQVADLTEIVKNALAAHFPAYHDIKVGGFLCGMEEFEPGKILKDVHPVAAARIYAIANARL